ncbi:hypothetical protein Lser_V15G38576 [Lactuca serriola]
MTTKIKNVQPVPTTFAIERKLCATTKFDTQFTVTDILPHIPLYDSGYILEFTVHGTRSIPGAKNAM